MPRKSRIDARPPHSAWLEGGHELATRLPSPITAYTPNVGMRGNGGQVGGQASGTLHHISVQAIGKSVIRGEKTAKAKKYSLTGIPTTTARKIKICFAIAWSPCYYKFMIQFFRNKGTEDIFYGKNTKNGRKICPQSLWKIASRKLDQIDSVQFLEEFRIPPGNNLESLSGDRIGENSIRINDQYRICFKWAANGPYQVEITDYH